MKNSLTRHVNILDYALASLWRRKMKNISVLVVFAGVIFLVASFQMVTRALTETADLALRNAPEITVQKMSAGRQAAVPLEYSEKIAALYGIRDIVPRIWGYYFEEVEGANYTVMGVDVRRMPLGDKLHLTLEEGVGPDPEKRGVAAVGKSIQEIINRKGGSLLTLYRPDLTLASFEVTGVFKPETGILTDDLVVMHIDDARDLFGISAGMATDLCVYVTNKSEIVTIAGKIAALLPDTRVLTRDQIGKTYQVVFGWRSGFASVCLLAALTAFAILAWDKASGLSPEEKREISILKILGWETSDILAVRFWEGFLVSGLAFVAGCTLAYLHTAFFDAALFKPVLIGWSVIHPSLHLVPSFKAADFLLIFCFSVLPYLTATVIPAWKNASVPADSALSGGI
ncbi:MAG: FtsX-like permease family protein [Desulfobulbaceae bacterium]|nr:FtsX-like permease family protein [Desulfobulbaceae bacterium]